MTLLLTHSLSLRRQPLRRSRGTRTPSSSGYPEVPTNNEKRNTLQQSLVTRKKAITKMAMLRGLPSLAPHYRPLLRQLLEELCHLPDSPGPGPHRSGNRPPTPVPHPLDLSRHHQRRQDRAATMVPPPRVRERLGNQSPRPLFARLVSDPRQPDESGGSHHHRHHSFPVTRRRRSRRRHRRQRSHQGSKRDPQDCQGRPAPSPLLTESGDSKDRDELLTSPTPGGQYSPQSPTPSELLQEQEPDLDKDEDEDEEPLILHEVINLD